MNESHCYTVEPLGAGYTVTFIAANLEHAAAKARRIANDRLRCTGAEWRLYDAENELVAKGDRWGVLFV